MTEIDTAYISEQGRRPNNEDAFAVPYRLINQPLGSRGFSVQPETLASPLTQESPYLHKGYLFVVADGVGGNSGGEIASALAVQEIGRRYYRDPSPDIQTSLRRAVEAANRQLRETQRNSGMTDMATTVTAAVIMEDGVAVAQVGDSRAYVFHDGEAQLLTHDHTWVQEMVNQGHMSVLEATHSPERNRVTRCLGLSDQVGVDVFVLAIAPGARFLLCSDGLSGYVDTWQLGRIVEQETLQRAAIELADTAYDNGSTDNITAVLMEIRA